MPEDQHQADPQSPDTSQAEAPPWGSDFDPERAWNLVQNLREDNSKLKSRPVLTDEHQQKLAEWAALEEASKSEYDRMQEALGKTQQDAESARAEAIRYKAAATHGISADHFDLLGSGSEEEITARAQKIAALVAAHTTPPAPSAPQTRPVEQMRPGATPGGTESEDDVLFAQLFGSK